MSDEIIEGVVNPVDVGLNDANSQDRKILTELAELSLIEYDRVRVEKSEELKVRPATLDKEIAKLRPKNERSEIKGRAIELYEPEPWHESINGASVLDEAANHLFKHMHMNKADVYACVLWAAHTYIFDGFYHSARLLITAPDKECGKSVLLFHMIGNLVNKPQSCENITPAPFFRIAELYKPTFLIDEADVFIKQDADLSGALNGGWEPHGGVIRCVGDDQEPRRFSTFCPTAIAGIEIEKKLPGPTVSRSIIVNLDRAVDGEIPKENEYDARIHKKALLETGQKLARWCSDNKQRIHKCNAELPGGVKNRLADKWSPLFAIAEIAGGDWRKHATNALVSQIDTSEPSKSELLLQDIKKVTNPDEHIFTATLIDRLCSLEGSLWREYNFKAYPDEKKKIKDIQIAKLLKKYKLEPEILRMFGRRARGYKRANLDRVFSRYLKNTDIHTKLPMTPCKTMPSKACRDSKPVTKNKAVTGSNSLKPMSGGGCHGDMGNLPPTRHIETKEVDL